MGMLHSIRLQGPWEVVPPDAVADDISEPVTLPASWRELFGGIAGQAIYSRSFHRPTGLQSGDRVCVRLCEQCGREVSLQINGQQIASVPSDCFCFDVSACLETYNRLRIGIHFDPSADPDWPGGLWQPVLLEIHTAE